MIRTEDVEALRSLPRVLVFGRAAHPSRLSFARLDLPLEPLATVARSLVGTTAEFWEGIDAVGRDLVVIGEEHIEGGASPFWCIDSSTGVVVTIDLEADDVRPHRMSSSVAHLRATIAAFRDWRALGRTARFEDLRATLHRIEGDSWAESGWRELLDVLEDGAENAVVFEERAS